MGFLSPLRYQRVDRAHLDDVRDLLVALYAEVYADRIDHPFWTIDQFNHRLDSQTTAPNWEAVIGHHDQQPIGYIYGATAGPDGKWWNGVHIDVDDPDLTTETGARTLTVFELMARTPWRGTGAAHAIHEELIRPRAEERVTLAVERDHPRVRAMYERWGYTYVGWDKPTPDAPTLDIMMRDLCRTDSA